MKPRTRRLPFALLLAAPAVFAAADAGEPEEAFRALTLYRFPEARAGFEEAGGTPAARFGLALALINLQPKTEANLARADALLDTLTVTAGTDPELARAARFYRGRIAQVHRRQPDPAAAQRLFRGLMDEAPDTFWGQFAGVKWTTLEIYTAGPPGERAARLAQLESLTPFFTLPRFAKDYHNIMANAYEALGLSDERAFAHLAACWRIGIARGVDQGDFLARLGTLAERLGRRDDARAYYAEFLQRFQRDERRHLIARRLDTLGASARP